MYKLYNVKAWGSMGVHFLLEEMAVPYTNIWMTAEQVAAPEYRELSPLGYIPALGLDDGERLCLPRQGIPHGHADPLDAEVESENELNHYAWPASEASIIGSMPSSLMAAV